MSNVFSFVKGEVFIGVIRDKNVDQCPILDLVNAINDFNVGIFSFGSAVISKEVCCMCGDEWSLILIGTTPLCLGGILRVDFTVPIVAVWVLACVKAKNLHFIVYSSFCPYPKHKIMRISSVYQC